MSEIKVNSVVNSTGDNDSGLDLSTNDNIKFKIANSQKAVIDASGNLGLGTSSPNTRFHIVGTNQTNGTVQFEADSAKGTLDSFVHYGTTGDWYIRSSNASGNVIIQDTGGNVAIGTSTPTGGNTSLDLHKSGSGVGTNIAFANDHNTDKFFVGIAGDTTGDALIFNAENSNMIFGTNNSERARFDNNGTFLVNDTARALTCKAQITYSGASEQGLIFENTANSASGGAIRFVDVDGDFSGGGIYYHDSNSINYQTTSDYRLKENIVTDWDATTELKKLKPSKFNFKKTPSKTVQGFIAHEVSDIVPEAIIGVKDGTEKYIDDKDGKEKTREAYQSIDQSKLVPLVTKALQEAIAKIETLEAEIAKLKG